MIGGTSGSDTKLCQPCSSQSKTAQTRSSSEGSRKTSTPLDPCCLRFSAPLVEKHLELLFAMSGRVVAVHPPSGREDRGSHKAFLRIDRPEALDDLEAAVSDLGDVHVHARMVLAWHHGRR